MSQDGSERSPLSAADDNIVRADLLKPIKILRENAKLLNDRVEALRRVDTSSKTGMKRQEAIKQIVPKWFDRNHVAQVKEDKPQRKQKASKVESRKKRRAQKANENRKDEKSTTKKANSIDSASNEKLNGEHKEQSKKKLMRRRKSPKNSESH